MVGIILAAGSGTRMKAEKNKVFLKLCGKEMLLHTVEAFEKSKYVREIMIVTGSDDMDLCKNVVCNCSKGVKFVTGGSTRQESSYFGVLAAHSEFVLIHDAARALVLAEDIDAVAEKTMETGAAAVGTPCIDTMKRCLDGKIISTVDRENLYRIYTPQGFRRDTLLDIHENARERKVSVTDDCALYEWAGKSVEIISGSPLNIKLTTPEDMLIAEAILNNRKS